MTDRMTTGRRGEQLAAEHLAACGFEVLDRNWRCRDGEIDVVARDGRDLVCVEVRTRSGVRFGTPGESITFAKLCRMRRVATAWRLAHPELVGRLRLDFVGVLLRPGEPPRIEHLRGIGDRAAS